MTNDCHVPVGKVRDYLLNPDHEDGGPKCAFFEAHGFARSNHEELAAALAEHFRAHEPTHVFETPFGVKLIVRGVLETPDGRRPVIKSVWIKSSVDSIARFVTAMPR